MQSPKITDRVRFKANDRNTSLDQRHSEVKPQQQTYSQENDGVFRRTGLSVGVVTGTDRTNRVFGFEPYIVPARDNKPHTANGKFAKGKRVIEFEEDALKFKLFPACNKHNKQKDWLKNFNLHRGEFLKGPKVTFTEATMKS